MLFDAVRKLSLVLSVLFACTQIARAETTDPGTETTPPAPPTFSTLTANPAVLWPPNHKMVAITLTADATDSTGVAVTCKIISVESNEPENGTGDGNTSPDWEITGDLTLSLRAERSGNGNGRIYTVTVECTDATGLTTTKTVTVTVPHDQGGDDDEECIEVGDFTTYSQAEWGAPASGDNGGAYRDANFASAFPTGVVIGASAAGISGNSATFTTPAAVEAFLPAIGAPAALATDYTDPVTTEAGALAGQVLALTLNVGFDNFDENFSDSSSHLKDLIVKAPGNPCDGKTVQEVLDLANTILGGGTSDISAQDISDCVGLINENFANGEINGGFLIDPNCGLSDEDWDECKSALKEKSGKTFSNILHKFDKDRDGKLKGKEKSKLRKALKKHTKSKGKGKKK